MGTDQHLPLYRRQSPRRGVGADRHLRPPTATRRSRELTRASRDQLAIERLSPASGRRGHQGYALSTEKVVNADNPLRALEIPLRISYRSSRMERLWSLAGATGGNRSQWETAENSSNSRIGNQWQPTATVSERMVRRGSTVRVRQRALQERRKSALSHSGRLAASAARAGYGALESRKLGPPRPRHISRQTGRFDCSARLRSNGHPGRGGSSGFPARGRLGV